MPATQVESQAPWARAIDSLASAEVLIDALLTRCVIDVRGQLFRPAEVELYLNNAVHPDPFTHGLPEQERAGHWYLHRSGPGGGFKGGSFKGIDLACGQPGGPAGVLIRSLERANGPSAGALITGPSLCVDALLAATGCASAAELHAALGDLCVSALDCPVQLATRENLPARRPFRTARVGLTLKDRNELEQRMRFVLRRYRWLTAPRAIKKGRLLLLLSLLADGWERADIAALTGSPPSAIDRAATGLAHGRALPLTDFVGKHLDSATLASMYGSFLAQEARRE